ncbi:urease accessory protein [Bradyrhizobium canariense]|uniref:HoxN/HupN/NixA family nickel/cobalt transporter n=1 Tax=Bradyrhizobium canariense TaxID=255045 RepID=UPI000A194D66|nr:urease accessory protein [Bradyrhizobium canariense]OSI61472.1 urease accessory protein [Bradyrhizobium canariense]
MFGILGLGFLLGMQHALEADHIAAVSSIAARRTNIGDIVRHGLTWGLGHTLALFVFAGVAILLGRAIPESLAQPLETAVGVMLIGLGINVLWKLWRDRVHFHRHGHFDGTKHTHVHSHRNERTIDQQNSHTHAHGFRWRSLLVGLVHGIAGSAALLVLAVSQISNPVYGMLYVGLFGVGSMFGMGCLSIIIAVPLAISARWLTWTNRAIQGVVGAVTIGLGALTVYATAIAYSFATS